jgi:purine-cytosine permease-like protein
MTGGYLSFRGLGILESFVVLGSLALLTGIMVGVLSHQGFRRGLTAQDLVGGSFGRRGAVAPALIIALLQSASVTVLLWWASDLVVDIISGAGLWPYERWIGQAGAWALLIAVTAALTLVGPRVLRSALFAGSGAALIALALVLVLSLPSLDPSLDWSWSADWMTVVSAGSVVLSLATLLFVFSAADLATLIGSSESRGGGVLSAIVLVLPMLAFAGVSSWLAQSSPVTSLGLLANPVGVFTDGAPAFYPTLAIVAVVVPLVALAALLTRSASLVAPTLPLPGPARVHAAVVLGLVFALGSLALVFSLDLLDVAADLALTAGVIVAALGAILTKEWVVMGPKKPHQAPTVRVVPLVALVVAVAVGLGLVDSSVSWLAWQGYLFPLLDMSGLIDLSPAAPGVLVSFVVAGIISGLGAMAEWWSARKSADVDTH